MRFDLQSKYDDLFEEGWRPHLQSRKDLVTWACESHNRYLSARDVPESGLANCANYDALLKQYGPDYSGIKAKFGFIQGLFDE